MIQRTHVDQIINLSDELWYKGKKLNLEASEYILSLSSSFTICGSLNKYCNYSEGQFLHLCGGDDRVLIQFSLTLRDLWAEWVHRLAFQYSQQSYDLTITTIQVLQMRELSLGNIK